MQRREFMRLTGAGALSATLGGHGWTASARERDSAASISLAGSWRFTQGTPGAQPDQALPPLNLNDTIQLPGTTETNRKGKPNSRRETGRLTRVHAFNGPAWYQREVDIPADWQGKRITLFLERTKFTAAWVDDRAFGAQDSLVCPHVYDLTSALAPGKHTLTLLVDNSHHWPVGDPHQLSDHTQTNWNGIIGRIDLSATDPVWIESVHVTPDVAGRKAHVQVVVGNASGRPAEGILTLRAQTWNTAQSQSAPALRVPSRTTESHVAVDVDVTLGPDPPLWDEFSPAMHRLSVELAAAPYADQAAVDFGLREFRTRGTQFTINGRPVFLRGKHDACVFPLTGHPPMDVNGWLRYLSICRSYGINHIRCHTWCPPDAAFAAADRLGVYIQPELPNWAPYGKEEHDRYLTAEGDRILKAFGNHPSFVMLSLGNEMGESREAMANLVRHLRDVDPSRLYVQGSNNFFWDPHLAPGDDYWTTMRTRDSRGKVHITRGSFATVDGIGHVQSGPPSTMADFSEAIAGVPVPVVGHETGQFTVYPDYREIPKYTGPLQARNLEAFREKLRARGMLDQAEDFRKASGALAVICYREEFESAIRTPGFGGFQVLDLQDFPGQGTALVGILDAFMDSKELVTPAAWREFCSETVLLARFDKYTWTTDEAFSAALDVAHYGATELPNAQAVWKLADGHGREVAAGETSAMPVTQGEVTRLGALSASLAAVHAPARLELELRLAGTEVVNHYSVWVYPPKGAASVPANVTLARSLDADARHVLAGGGRVLLIPLTGSLSRTVGGGFATDFWCWPMFHNKPGTMGLLCDPKHPALAGFPTETHSDWHWFHIASGARPIILDSTPTGFRPIIQVIDNLERDHKLGILFETHVGPGRLLICASDLLAMQDQPEARQLLSSLLKYCASDAFRPAEELPAATLDSLLQSDLALGKPATTSSVQTQPGFGPERANDGDASTRWCAADAQTGCWWQVDLGQPADLSGCEITWEFNGRRYQYLVEGSADGKNWETLSDQRNTQDKEQEQHLSFQSSGTRCLRITVTGLETGAWASICDVKVFGRGDSR